MQHGESAVTPQVVDVASHRRQLSTPTLLLVLGAFTVVATVVGAIILPLTPIRMSRSSADLIPESGLWRPLAELPWPVPSGANAIASTIVVTAVLALVAYVAALVAVWDRPATSRLLIGVLAPAGLALLVSTLALPTQSSDIVDYLLSGRVAVVHGADPSLVPPDDFPDDPFLPYASGNYTDDPEAKPPIWLGAAAGAAALTSESSPADAILTTRVLFLGLTVANTGLIAAILRRWRPRHLLAGLVLYTWNPIVLVHGQAKFDTLMATFALLAGYALVRARPVATVAALWGSVMVKLLTGPMLVVSVVGDLVARRWRQVAASAAIVVAMTIVLHVPFDGGVLDAIRRLTDAADSGSSLPAVVTPVVALVGLGLLLWAGLSSHGEIEGTLQGWAVAALTIVPLSMTSSAWYLIMPIAVVSLCGELRRTALLVAFSALAYLLDAWGRHSNPDYPLPEPFGLSRAQAVVVALTLAAVLGAIWYRLGGTVRVRRGRTGSGGAEGN